MDAVKRRHGVPLKLASCHTAIVSGYVIEGHVPADLIDRLLTERPRSMSQYTGSIVRSLGET